MIGITEIKTKRGAQWNRPQVEVSGGVGTTGKIIIKNDRYHCHQEEKGSPMG
jgi:hypothetical protein